MLDMRHETSAFSLVELVVVIVIIGIVAAIAAPRAGRSAEAAAEASIIYNLRTVRTAIELYAAEHGGVYPAANGDGKHSAGTRKAFRDQLTLYTNEQGLASSSLDRANFPYGPYLVSVPTAPLGPAKGDGRVRVKSAGTPLSGNTTPGRAWKFDDVTGEFIFNYNGVSSDGVTKYEEW